MIRGRSINVRSRNVHHRRYQRSQHQVSHPSPISSGQRELSTPAATTQPAILQIVGYKNSGKTTLVCALIPLLQQKGYTVAVIKHDAHSFEIDHEGTDTWRHRKAGAAAIAITGGARTVRIEERGSRLADLAASFAGYDFILVEGFKNETYPKIVLIQREEDLELLKELNSVWAAAVWAPMNNAVTLEVTKASRNMTSTMFQRLRAICVRNDLIFKISSYEKFTIEKPINHLPANVICLYRPGHKERRPYHSGIQKASTAVFYK